MFVFFKRNYEKNSLDFLRVWFGYLFELLNSNYCICVVSCDKKVFGKSLIVLFCGIIMRRNFL